jgi:hypothetical protein
MLLGQPRAQLGIAHKAVRLLQVFLERGQGCGRDVAAMRGLRHLVTEHLVQATLGVGIEPGGHTMAGHAQQGRQCLALLGVPAHDQKQGLQALPLLDVFCLFHALMQLCSAFGDGRHLLSHTTVPS